MEKKDYSNRVQYDLDYLIEIYNNIREFHQRKLDELGHPDTSDNKGEAIESTLENVRDEYDAVNREIIKRLTTDENDKPKSVEERLLEIEWKLHIEPRLRGNEIPNFDDRYEV